MRFDVYDMDDEQWACWDPDRGYLSGWLKKKDYNKWWLLQYGVMGRRLPSAHTMNRTEADEKEKMRIDRERSKRRGA